jgi:hypothetical protein|tara:strand:- start:159 stop:533 length:375 start_codon:yes stop_codon:yes gene_type:complete
MSYSLQPGLQIVNDHAVPEYRATEHVFAPPQPSNTGHCCRPSTEIFGTAPYMAEKGAPAHLIDQDDALRPQSTKEFNKTYAQQPYDFPRQNVNCKLPTRVWTMNPGSTRAEVQNGMFLQRYCKE